jgi:hypothetical protein
MRQGALALAIRGNPRNYTGPVPRLSGRVESVTLEGAWELCEHNVEPGEKPSLQGTLFLRSPHF